MRHARWLSLVLLLACAPLMASSAPRTAAPAQPPLDSELMGMVVRDPWFDFATNPAYPGQSNKAFQDRMGAELAAMGVRWVRLDFRIATGPLDMQAPTPEDVVKQEIAKNDYFINEVAPRHGLKVLGLLSFDLIQGTDANLLDTGPFTVTSVYGGGVNRYMDEWLRRALLVADQYGDNVAAYEVLNEQNRLPQYLPGGPSGNAIEPNVVARLVTKLYRFCRGIAPLPRPEPYGCANAEIVLGGLHPRGTTVPSFLSDADYLKAIYGDPNDNGSPFQEFKRVHGRWPVDGIGYHPYPEEIRLSPNKDAYVDRGLARIRTALEQSGDACRQLWITEVGYNVGFDVDGPSNPIPQQSESGQASFMEDVYTGLAARQICGGQREIASIFWFKYEDFPPWEDIRNNQGQLTAAAQRWGVVRIPFEDGACPGGACYDVSGAPSLRRVSYYTYRRLAGLPSSQISAPLVFK